MSSSLNTLCWTDETVPMGELQWPETTEMVGVRVEVQAPETYALDPYYAKGLHAWFLDQVRQTDPRLSAELAEKAFTLSRLVGSFREQGGKLIVPPKQPFHWMITGLNAKVCDWLRRWTQHLPYWLELRGSPLQICGWGCHLPPMGYRQLLEQAGQPRSYKDVCLSFVSPTSFRHRGHHLPLPIPKNLFHSYLRRWNDFSGLPIEMEPLLDGVDRGVLIQRYRLETVKTTAGRRGSVTGFVGSLQLGFSTQLEPQEQQQIRALLAYAPYAGTGHKTPFGLGQTRLGWESESRAQPVAAAEEYLAERIRELMATFLAQRQRQGGSRAEKTALSWATILARREGGESLELIAQDLEMPYETVKTYAKLARRALRQQEG
ncbi:MAG: CRISPR-associated endoribonuclease Cas6 [Thermostichus sp. DRC_bins_24]